MPVVNFSDNGYYLRTKEHNNRGLALSEDLVML